MRSLYASRARRSDQAVQHYGSEPTKGISSGYCHGSCHGRRIGSGGGCHRLRLDGTRSASDLSLEVLGL